MIYYSILWLGETMSKWFFINFIIFIFALWKVHTGSLMPHRILGGIGMLFILYNWMRHAVFTTIRSNISRKRKIKYATISKKLLPFHKWTGSTALVIILLHVIFVLRYYPLQIHHVKMISGLLALGALIGVVTFGWLRHIRTTVVRRYVHWSFAYAVIILAVIHLLF